MSHRLGRGIIYLGCLLGIIFALSLPAAAQSGSLLNNGGFERFDTTGRSLGWMGDLWKPGSRFGITRLKIHAGQYAAFIQSKTPNDARFIQTVPVEPNTVYRFSGWIATFGVPAGKSGANLCVMEPKGFIHSAVINGQTDWQPVALLFRTGYYQNQVTLGVRLGFYGETLPGIAYFDDLELTELADPENACPVLDSALPYRPSQALIPPEPADPDFTTGEMPILSRLAAFSGLLGYPTATVLFYLLLLGGLALRRNELNELMNGEPQNGELCLPNRWFNQRLGNRLNCRLDLWFGIAVVLALGIRIPLLGAAPVPHDLSAFKLWALRMADMGPARFYAPGIFCDYPPFPLYLLGLCGWFIKIVGGTTNPLLFNTLIKLPSFLCDLATAWLIFSLLRKKHPALSFCLALIYLFLPPVIYNSAYWGQVDSYYAFLMVSAFYFLVKKRPEPAAVLVVASLLTKAQTIAFLPLLFLYFPLRFGWRKSFRAALVGAAVAILILLPISPSHPVTWAINHYLAQAGLYPYATMNAANLWMLFSANFVNDATKILPGLSYRIPGIILFLAGTGWSCYYYYRKRTPASLAAGFAVSALALFLFFPRMHERYLYPALAFLLLAVGYYRDKKIYLITLIFSLSYFFNMHAVVLKDYIQTLAEPAFSRVMYILALINITTFTALLLYLGVRPGRNGRHIRSFFQRYATTLRSGILSKLKQRPFHLEKRDYCLLGILLLLYAVFLFHRLGSWSTPRSGYTFKKGELLQITLARMSNLNGISWYSAIGAGRLLIQADDGSGWKDLAVITSDGVNDFYKLRELSIKTLSVNRLRLVSLQSGWCLNEMAFFDAKHRMIPVATVQSDFSFRPDPAARHPLWDEPERIKEHYSYYNSTYFDEIYHGRTAYEFITGSPVYETTHPPFGKDWLSLGILLFGMNPFGMRFMHIIAGIGLIITLFFLGRQVLASRFGAYCTMLLGMLDFMPFVQSRYATIDSTSVLFITLMFLFTFKYVREQETNPGFWNSTATFGLIMICFALAAATKWTGVYGLAGIAGCILIVLARQYRVYHREQIQLNTGYIQDTSTGTSPDLMAKNHTLARMRAELQSRNFWRNQFWATILGGTLLLVIIVPSVYYLTYIPFLKCQGVISPLSVKGISTVLQSQKNMYDYHSKLTAPYVFESNWWSWPFDFKPNWIYPNYPVAVRPGDKVTIVSMGNPLIWFLGLIALVVLAYQLLTLRRFSLLHLVVIAFLSVYLPWILVTRATVIYHFFPCLPLYLTFAALLLEPLWRLGRAGRRVVYTILICSFGLLLLFYPALTGMEVAQSFVNGFLRWFPRDWVF